MSRSQLPSPGQYPGPSDWDSKMRQGEEEEGGECPWTCSCGRRAPFPRLDAGGVRHFRNLKHTVCKQALACRDRCGPKNRAAPAAAHDELQPLTPTMNSSPLRPDRRTDSDLATQKADSGPAST